MQKPQEPFKSGNYICMPKHETETLDTNTYVHPDCIDRFLEGESDYDRYRNDDELPKGLHEWNYDTDLCSLQDLLDLAKGKNPKDVVISMYRNREIDHVSVCVEYRTRVDEQSWKAAKAAEEAEYKQKYKEYVEADKAYQLWCAEQDLEATIARIANLKK